MNHKLSLSIFFICAVLSLFSACTNITDKKHSVESETLDFTIQLYDKNSDAALLSRSICPSFDLSLVSVWKIYFTDVNDSSNTFTLSTDSTATGSESYAVLSGSTLTLSRIPQATYKIELEGSFTKDSETGTFYGSLSELEVGSSLNSVTLPVGLKKSESGTGSLALTFTDSDSYLSNYYSKIKLTLTSVFSSRSYEFEVSDSSTDSTDSSDSTGEFIYSATDGTFTLTKKGIPSGYYTITLSYNSSSTESGFKVSIPEQYRTVEVVDGIQTKNSDVIKLSIETEKNYYATNSSFAANKNGLSVASKKYLKSLLALIAQNIENDKLEESTVNIYMAGEIPEIDADTYSTLVNAIEQSNKSFVFGLYGDSQTEKSSLTIINVPSDSSDSTQSLSCDINYSIVLTAGDSSSTFNVNTLTATSGSPFSLTFKNGAKLVASDDESSLLNAEITIKAIKGSSQEDYEDNYEAYLLTDDSTTAPSALFECVLSDISKGDTPCVTSFALENASDCAYELVDVTPESVDETSLETCKTYFKTVTSSN